MLIAQITDIHAGADNNNLTRLQRVIHWLDVIKPNLLVITGDLIDDGWNRGYEIIATILAQLNCRILILPGNSDDKNAMRNSLQPVTCWASETQFHFSEVNNGVPVIGIDTTLTGKVAGSITPHFEWLNEELEGYSQPAMLFTHHHLFSSGIVPLDNVICQGASSLAALIHQSHVPPLALCSGHVHRSMSSVIAGVPAYICGSICPENPLLLNADSPAPPVNHAIALMIHDIRPGHRVSSHISL